MHSKVKNFVSFKNGSLDTEAPTIPSTYQLSHWGTIHCTPHLVHPTHLTPNTTEQELLRPLYWQCSRLSIEQIVGGNRTELLASRYFNAVADNQTSIDQLRLHWNPNNHQTMFATVGKRIKYSKPSEHRWETLTISVVNIYQTTENCVLQAPYTAYELCKNSCTQTKIRCGIIIRYARKSVLIT